MRDWEDAGLCRRYGMGMSPPSALLLGLVLATVGCAGAGQDAQSRATNPNVPREAATAGPQQAAPRDMPSGARGGASWTLKGKQ